MRTKLLFICSRNQWRSPTAQALFRHDQRYEARSAGTSSVARNRVNSGHINWADQIFVMEPRHRQLLQQRFTNEVLGEPMVVLDIPDDYTFMDPDLVDLIRVRLSAHLEANDGPQ